MSMSVDASRRALILAPAGRDARVAKCLLEEIDVPSHVCGSIASLVQELRTGAAFALVTDEALNGADLRDIAAWIADQPPWSDFPFLLLTERGMSLQRNPHAQRLTGVLGNVSFLERPFHAMTFASLARTAVRGRMRQYQARAAQQALAESESRYRTLTETLPQLVWTCLPDGRCDYLSTQWLEYTGVRPEEQLDLRWLDRVVHPGDRDRVYEHWMGAVNGQHGYDIEFRIRRHDGTYHWFKTRGAQIRDAAGRILYWFGTCTDIQDIVEAREIAARGRDELETIVDARTAQLRAVMAERESVEAALRQSQKMEAVGQLTGGIAHDFNNLLQGIIGSLDRVQKRISQGRTTGLDPFLEGAMKSAQRAASLTHRLLAFSRRQPLDPRALNANQLIASMEDLLRRTMGEQIQIELVAAGGLWLTRCDQNLLENAVLNLSINARDAMPEGGKLTIETANTHLDAAYTTRQREVAPGQYVCLSVTDTGSGMSPDVIARAFDPFFTTKPLGQGTGLGLSMVYGFARQSEGSVGIYSELGRGTTIKLYLPRYRGNLPEDTPSPQQNRSRAAASGEVVLIVEDDGVVRKLVVDVLSELGYWPLEAGDGRSGLEILQSEQRVDLLVTDVGLPGVNGRQMADAARVKRPDLKVLFMTGYAENAVIAHGFLDPGMEMIIKPFAIDMLAARVSRMLQMG